MIPDVTKLSQSKILVTTLVTARLLFLMGLSKGHFTHIFVDEAAQVFIVPLCVVMQMSSGCHLCRTCVLKYEHACIYTDTLLHTHIHQVRMH